MSTPIIDLFAGPGGLGEGFSTLRNPEGNYPFTVRLSIEKDPYAYQTLELRSFYRQFRDGQVPNDYYHYCRGNISRKDLFDRHPIQTELAKQEAWMAELGKVQHSEVDARIEKVLGGRKGWVLIGGPPCQAYSMVGRARMRKKDPERFEADDRHFLYKEYLRILRKYQPSVFVMENVKGLLSSRVNGEAIFSRIIKDLRRKPHGWGEGYEIHPLVTGSRRDRLRPGDYVIPFEDYGVPQTRHRVILLGIRRDLPQNPRLLRRNPETPTVKDAIQDLPPIRSRLSKESDSLEAWTGALHDVWSKDFGSIPDEVAIRDRITRAIWKAGSLGSGNDRYYSPNGTFKPKRSSWLNVYRDWFLDCKIGSGALNHCSRAHMREDLVRYLFLSTYAEVREESPKLRDFPKALLPNHANVGKAMENDNFNDRFRVQVWGKAATTVVSHISKDGHYYIHPDPSQCRSLTVREAARLQTFPDNYFFEGPRTQQYRQVGNAVPPLFSKQIAEVVFNILQQEL